MNKITSIAALLLAGLVASSLSACNKPGAEADAAKFEAAPPCHACGTIAGIEQRQAKGEGSGAGAVMGAIAGAVVGHQFGGGRGQDVATAGGAVAGGYAGNEAEKNMNQKIYYHVTVRMEEDGALRTLDVPQLNGLALGDKVEVHGNKLLLAQKD